MKAPLHWAQMQEWSLLWGMRLLFGVYRLCGRRVLQCCLYPVVSYYWLLNRTARLASSDYLQRIAACQPASQSLSSYQHFISFANAIIDKLAAWSGGIALEDVEYLGREHLLADLEQGRGTVLFASHLGNLEVCRVIATADPTIKINVLVHTKHAQKFNQLLNRYNPASGLNLLQVTEMNAATAMLLAEKIDNGELVIIAADRTPVGNQQRVSRVEFLGASALLPQGPFILAALLKCPVYSLFCFKQQDKHRIIFEAFSRQLSLPRINRESAIQAQAQAYAERLQYYCQQQPLQWFNFYDFWRM